MKETTRIIKKVIENKTNRQLVVTVPSGYGIKRGDYVEIIRLKIKKLKTKNILVYETEDVFLNKNNEVELKR